MDIKPIEAIVFVGSIFLFLANASAGEWQYTVVAGVLFVVQVLVRNDRIRGAEK